MDPAVRAQLLLYGAQVLTKVIEVADLEVKLDALEASLQEYTRQLDAGARASGAGP